MKKKNSLIEILIYFIFIISLLSYENRIYKFYSYIQMILFGFIFLTLLLCLKEKKICKMFYILLKKNKIIIIISSLMIINTLLCSLFYQISITSIIIVFSYVINILFFYFLIPIYFYENFDFADKLTNFIIVIISALSIFGIILYFNNGLFGYRLESGRSGSIYFDSNYFALVASVPIALILKKNYRLFHKMIILFIAVAAILCSGSRGTMLGLSIGIVYYISIKFSNKSFIKKAFVILLTAFSMYMFFLYLEKISFLRVDQGSHGRLEMFEYAINEMKQSPIIGFGFGSISDHLSDAGFANTNTHNSLIDFAFRYGYPCLAFYILLIIKTVYRSFKDKKNVDIDILVIIFLVNMNTILLSFGGLGIVSIILTICLGVLGCFGRINEKDQT